ncbi:MAG: oligopeptide:H+ symporter [Francisella sp.]
MQANYNLQKHPKSLWYMIAIYIWEYFSFYGMRSILILYLLDQLRLGDSTAYAISGAYITLIYLSPISGGIIADKLLGYKKSVILGSILMSIGHIILGISSNNQLYLGMAFIICGYGFFKSNISCLLGQQYNSYDPNKDSGFTLLYLGGNLGSILAPIACGLVAHYYGWHYGFGLAGIGMIFGLIIFMMGSKHIPNVMPEKNLSKNLENLILSLSILLIVVVSYLSLEYLIEGYLLSIVTTIAVIYFIYIFFKVEIIARKSLIKILPFFIFGIIFWIFDEQMFTSIEVFIHRNVDTYFFGINIPASSFTSINSFSLFLGGLIVAWIWKKLKSLDNDFGRMIKFSFGFIFQLLCFTLFFQAAKDASIGGTTSALFVVIALVFLGISELFIDPIALSEVTSIRDKRYTGFLAAFYMLTTGSVAGFIGAHVANLSSFNDTMNNSDLVSQAVLFKDLFANIIFILMVLILLWYILAFFIRKLK